MSEMFADLLAAQKEMPALQKSGINPHFGNKYVPLEELLTTVIPILNKHNLVLLQMPTFAEGQAALEYRIVHTSGESINNIMLLCAAKDDPQGQGSAITYARRYSLMSLLGLTADVDDDAEGAMRRPQPRGGQERPVPTYDQVPPRNPTQRVPPCPQGHGPMKLWPAGTSKSGKVVSANYKCQNRTCKNEAGWPESMWADAWEDQLSQEAAASPSKADLDADLPFE